MCWWRQMWPRAHRRRRRDPRHQLLLPGRREDLPALHRPHRARRQQRRRGDPGGLGRCPRWALINKALGPAFAEPPETYSTSEHVYTGLGIPEGATGRLPKSLRTRAGLEAGGSRGPRRNRASPEGRRRPGGSPPTGRRQGSQLWFTRAWRRRADQRIPPTGIQQGPQVWQRGASPQSLTASHEGRQINGRFRRRIAELATLS